MPTDVDETVAVRQEARAAQDIFVRSASSPTHPVASRQQSGCPVDGAPAASAAPPECPVAGAAPPLATNPLNNMPEDRNAAQPGQRAPLSTARQPSSIPIADPSSLPPHQRAEAADGDAIWNYPSQQMFYNAMKRKGWNPNEADMDAVVRIHNAVNERVWQHILHWESLHARECSAPKLLKFTGRPRDYSPRALMLNALGYKLPFDRHDWVVDRCGTHVRYVIDFYAGNAASSGAPAAMHVDVRPALDSVGACVDRVRMAFIHFLSGT